MPTGAGSAASDDDLDARLLVVLRDIFRLTQGGLEEVSGVSRATLSRIETRKRELGRKDRVKLAHGLGLSVRTLGQISDLIRQVDQEASGWAGSSEPGSELAEESAGTRRAMRRARHRRIAESVGKAAEETTFQMLEVGDLDAYDDY